MASKNTVGLNVQVPQLWADKIDEKAEQLGASVGTRFDRSDVVRIALARFLGIVEEKEVGAATTPA